MMLYGAFLAILMAAPGVAVESAGVRPIADVQYGAFHLGFRSEPPKRRYEVTAPIGKGAARGLPKIYGPADARLPLVVIDAGHGGHDPGAINALSGKRGWVPTGR